MKHTLPRINVKTARRLQAQAFSHNPRLRAAPAIRSRRVKAGPQFGALPILLQEKRGAAWTTVAAFKDTPRSIKRARSYAARYAAHERVAMRLVKR